MKKSAKISDCSYPETLMCCPDFVLSTVAVTMTDRIEKVLAPLGIRLKHYRLLRVLYFEGPQRQNDLGTAMEVDRTTVVALVDHLEQRKFAKRERSPDDRRAYRVRLTPKGEKLAAKATALVTALEQDVFSPLDRKEQETLRRLSTRLLASFT